jgi:hypothetical protein
MDGKVGDEIGIGRKGIKACCKVGLARGTGTGRILRIEGLVSGCCVLIGAMPSPFITSHNTAHASPTQRAGQEEG